MGKRHRRTMLATQYSAFPAIIVVQEEDDGRQIIVPIPLNSQVLWCWLRVFFMTTFQRFNYPGVFFGLVLSTTPWLMDNLVEKLHRVHFSVQLGTVLARSLAWGVLGI